MANEISVSQSISVTKSNLKFNKSESYRATLAGTVYDAAVQNIGTTYEQVSVSGIGTAGLTHFKNLDTTNYVEIGIEHSGTTFVPFLKLKAGESAVVRLATATIFAKANTLAVNLEYRVFED